MLRRVTFLFLAVIFILVGCADGENEIVVDKWKQSPLFESGGYSMIGVKDKIGFIYDNSELIRFYPNKENKYMWHIWFEDTATEHEKFTVKAIHQDDNEQITLIDNVSLSDSPNNGADIHLPSNMSFPKSGMWKLECFLDGVLFETIYVKVHEE